MNRKKKSRWKEGQKDGLKKKEEGRIELMKGMAEGRKERKKDKRLEGQNKERKREQNPGNVEELRVKKKSKDRSKN